MDLGMKGKVAVITGGSIGIGLAIAQELANEGVNLAICARNEEKVTRVAKTISDTYGVKAIGIQADVSKVEDVNHFVAKIEKVFGGVDFLINNAGIDKPNWCYRYGLVLDLSQARNTGCKNAEGDYLFILMKMLSRHQNACTNLLTISARW